MAAPNSYNFAVSRDNLITDALLHMNALGQGESASSAQLSESARILNMMLKLRANEVPTFSVRRGTILPVTETSSISTISHVVTNYDTTTISSAASNTDVQLTVTTTSGMAGSDQIGIEMDDGTMHWTTISSVDSATLVTVADAIDDDAAVGNYVYWYTASADRILRPLRVMDANYLNIADSSTAPINIDSRKDYYSLGDRTSAGSPPNRIFYDPILGDRTADPTSSSTWYGTFYVYPRFTTGDYVIEFTYQEPMQDLDAASDNIYVPQEFYLAVMLELAALLAPRYGVPVADRRVMMAEAKMYREEALETIREEGSLFLQPDSQ